MIQVLHGCSTPHNPAILAKQAANIDRIGGGRLALNVVSFWWADEARRYGVHFESHDDRYARTEEWLSVLNGVGGSSEFSYTGRYYSVDGNVLEPMPSRSPRPTIYAGGESAAAKSLITRLCDAYVTHGDPADRVAPKVAEVQHLRESAGLPPMTYGMAAYVIVREDERAAQRELDRITDVRPGSPGYGN